jgi:hypothetical protein
MKTERRVVDNRIFLLGLDEIYRAFMKQQERQELLQCARNIAQLMSISPADTPIEGYYAEDEQLTEYFLLMRALQQVPKSREHELHSNSAFRRLKQVTESRIFGTPVTGDYLLSVGKDALTVALETSLADDWNIESLTSTAHNHALKSGDFSLVALAALSHDSVVLTALRESVVLYEMLAAGAIEKPSEPEYVWEVDDIIETRAQQFVTTFNELFNNSMPDPVPQNAEKFWAACDQWSIIGRCVRIGLDDRVSPVKYYHWAIDIVANEHLIVKDFWDSEIWTTERYRNVISD